MPRSSGGGSHHSSSHHSSHHSSSSRSHSSGGGSHYGGSSYSGSRSYSGSHSTYQSGPKISRQYFSGARKYVRYRNSVPEYIYAVSSPSSLTGSTASGCLRTVLKFVAGFNIFLTVIILAVMVSTIFSAHRLNTAYDTRIVISDRAGVMENTAGLNRSMQAFLDQTGITPAVFCVYNEDWQPYYASLENYAYDLYVNSFTDESHWLWVYSAPKHPDPVFSDWYFEGMQGDNTTGIITSSAADRMVDDLQRGFTDRSVSVEQTFVNAFDKATNHAKNTMSPVIMSIAAVIILIPAGLAIAVPILIIKLMDRHNAKKYEGFVPADEQSKSEDFDTPEKSPLSAQRRIFCEYCGAPIGEDADLTCPHCGAPLPVQDHT